MSEFMDPRAAAEQEVRRRFEKERTDLVNVQRAQRRADLRDQKPVLDDLTRREDALREERRQALERIDREWQQERDRLGSRPLPAPAFGLAPSSAQNIRDAYVAAHAKTTCCASAWRRCTCSRRRTRRATAISRTR